MSQRKDRHVKLERMESGFKKDAKYLDAPSANDRMRVRQAGLRDEI